MTRGEGDADLLSDSQGGEDDGAVLLEEPEAVGGTHTSPAWARRETGSIVTRRIGPPRPMTAEPNRRRVWRT